MASMETPSRSVDPLVVGKVIGDVVDMFVPAVEFTVEYASKQITNNGVEIKPAAAAQKPRVHIKCSPDSNNLYTLDIPEGADASQGREVVEYMGPQPPAGLHRYVFTLFRQREAEQVPHKPPQVRSNF